ncbi:MAG: hypothetical protein K2Q09_05360 [Phycisphaerales bacterium]|nr:hypothetical protein [Phycisphaerales bacterium]
MSTANTRTTPADPRRRESVRPAGERREPAHSQEQQGRRNQRQAAAVARNVGVGAEVLVGDTRCAPSCDCIRARAFEIYQARAAAGEPGEAASDWLRAEEELTLAAANPSPTLSGGPPLIDADRTPSRAEAGSRSDAW